MEDLIPIINQLQDVFTAVGGTNPIDLPQIVVIGSQSSGKSSVLESFVYRDFLPRGAGICTRCPLILQLVHIDSRSNHFTESLHETEFSNLENEYGIFLHDPDTKYTDFEAIKTEIIRETERITGPNNTAISSRPINLKIFSPRLVNLTLVDLPGITKVAVGDQPSDIELQLRQIVLEYVSNPNSIILAVTAGNTDLTTSDALQLAKTVDPNGLRTIGVLTKLDLIDQGCDAIDQLNGKVVPLKLGYVGVKNRSQLDINKSVSIHQALENEEKFFQEHIAYRPIAHRLGSKYLSRCLNRLLMQHIKKSIPNLKSQLNSMISDLNIELKQYGDPLLQQSASKAALLLHLLSQFSSSFCDAIDGKGKESFTISELWGGARISYIFHTIFSKELFEINPFDHLSDQDIATAIKNATGPKPSLFVPEISFELLSKNQIHRLKEPSLECVDLVFDEMRRVATQCENPQLMRFEVLRDKIIDCVNELLRVHREPTKKMVNDLINIELAYINTNHPDFIGGSKAVSSTLSNQPNTNTQQTNNTREKCLEDKENRRLNHIKNATRVNNLSNGNLSNFNSNEHCIIDSRYKDSVEQEKMFQKNSGEANKSPNRILLERKINEIASRGQKDRRSDISNYSLGNENNRASSQESIDLSIASRREQIEVQIIKSLILSYFKIARKNILDTVPKAIMHFLVNKAKEELQSALVCKLYKQEKFDLLLEENPAIAHKRTQCVELLAVLNKAMEIVNNVRDLKV